MKEVKACAEAARKAQEAAEAAAAKATGSHSSKKADEEDMDIDKISEYCPSSHGELDDNFLLSQESARELKKGHINKLLEIDGLDLRCDRILRHKIELNESFKPKNPSDVRTFNRTLQCMANAFVSILHTMIEDPNEEPRTNFAGVTE